MGGGGGYDARHIVLKTQRALRAQLLCLGPSPVRLVYFRGGRSAGRRSARILRERERVKSGLSESENLRESERERRHGTRATQRARARGGACAAGARGGGARHLGLLRRCPFGPASFFLRTQSRISLSLDSLRL